MRSQCDDLVDEMADGGALAEGAAMNTTTSWQCIYEHLDSVDAREVVRAGSPTLVEKFPVRF
jgi:hypothetical protein